MNELALAVAGEPWVDDRRLVYADWLEEHGRPAEGYAQRLRVKLNAVLREPAGDAPRLAYAAFLEGHAGAVPCPDCEDESGYRVYCRRCEGSGRAGRVSDGGRERAEFIRVQCELAVREGYAGTTESRWGVELRERMYALRYRERELLITHHKHWGPDLPGVPRGEWGLLDDLHLGWPLTPHVAIDLEFRRGFVGRVECTTADWCGGQQCRRCNGGIRPGHSRRCPDCYGTGRTLALGPKLVASQPVTGVRLTDRPAHRLGGSDFWCHPAGAGARALPAGVCDRLYRGRVPVGFGSAAAADRELSRGLVDWARDEAGLPPLEWPP